MQTCLNYCKIIKQGHRQKLPCGCHIIVALVAHSSISCFIVVTVLMILFIVSQLIIWLINLLFYGYMQTSSDGTKKEIAGATVASYMPSIDDIGSFISVSCEPVRSDWARGPMVLSEQIGPIMPGTKHFLFS